MKITGIEPRQRRLDAVYIDGAFAGAVDRDLLASSGLRVDSPIEQTQFHELLARSDAKRARDKALWLLGRRAYTRIELLNKLLRDSSQAAAEEAVARMEELGLVDDSDYARRYAAELAERRCYAAGRIVRELCRRGIDSELAENTVEALSPDPAEQIQRLLLGKFSRSLEGPNGKNKTAAALRRYGFSWSEIAPCLEERMTELAEESDADSLAAENTEPPAEDCEERISYLLKTKYGHALSSEKGRKRAVSSLVARGFSRFQVEQVLCTLCGLDRIN